MCTDTHTTLSNLQPGCKWAAGRGGFTEMELLLWMGPHQRRRAETALSSDVKWNSPFSWPTVHASPFRTRVLASMRSVMWTGSQTSDFGGLQGIAFPVKGSAMAQRPGHWEVDMATWHWSIQSAKAPSSPAHRLSPPQHGLATLPESTNEGLVRARTTIPQRLWWGRI